jgi:hypothetical protein
VRKAAEDTIGPFGDRPWQEVFQPQVELTCKRWMNFGNGLGVGLARGKRGDLYIGMAQQESDQLQG